MKSEVDKLDIDKLEATPVDLRKLSDVVKNTVAKKTYYNELIKKSNAIQTTDTSDLVKKTDYYTKINETEKKVLDHNHDKYITTQDFNKSMSENFAARLAQAKLVSKDNIADFVKENILTIN